MNGPAITTPLCWICGSPASTREHKAKRAILRSLFGKPSQSNPIYLRTDTMRNKAIGSLDSNHLKFSKSLCAECNNSRTQQHDLDWDCMCLHLSDLLTIMPKREFARTNSIFPYDTKNHMLNAHLYWVKMLGCLIKEHNIPIDTTSLSKAILNNQMHPNLYLAFGHLDLPIANIAAGSEMQIIKSGGKCVYATRIHTFGSLSVNMIYAVEGEKRDGLLTAWHPKLGTNRIKLTAFKEA